MSCLSVHALAPRACVHWVASDVAGSAIGSVVAELVKQHPELLADRHGALALHPHDFSDAHVHPPPLLLPVQSHDPSPPHFTGGRDGARSVTVS